MNDQFKYKIVFVGNYFALRDLLKDDEQYECHLKSWPQDPFVLCKTKEDFDFIHELMLTSDYEIISTFP